MRQVKGGCLRSSSHKGSTQRALVFNQECEEPTALGAIDLSVLSDIGTKDTSHASFFYNVWSMKEDAGYRKGGPCQPPETNVSLSSVVYRNPKTSGFFRINDSAIMFSNISTVDILHIHFLHSGVTHTLHLLPALASHCCPMTGSSHLTRVQLKTQSCMEPWACFSLRRNQRAMVSR